MNQCQAKSKRSQKQCLNWAVQGMRTCHMHGGKLGGKKARRARRLAVLKHGFFTKEAIEERKEVRALIKSAKERLM
jgi:hypothetical protein